MKSFKTFFIKNFFVRNNTNIYMSENILLYIGVDIMKNLELTTPEAVAYLKENVKIHDRIELSYNRIFAEGEVLNVDFSKYFDKPGFRLLISLDESELGATVEVDVLEVQEDIIEFVHYPKDGEEVDVTVI